MAYPVRTLNLSDEIREHFKLSLENDPSDWPVIIVLDHPKTGGFEPAQQPDAFYITLSDWFELNRALRSVSGLLQYTNRVLLNAVHLRVPLGQELERFRTFVEADEGAPGSRARSWPWLSFDALTDPDGANLYRALVEYLWSPDNSLPSVSGESYRKIVEFLDSVPPGAQAGLGRWILKKRRELDETAKRASGAWFTEKKLFVCLCNRSENEPDLDSFVAELAGLCTLRSLELREQLGEFIPALGIGVRVDPPGIDYRYFYMGESLPFPIDLRRSFEWRYGCFNFVRGGITPASIRRNELCPAEANSSTKSAMAVDLL